MSYIEMIEHTRMVDKIDAVVTTGDVGYPGTALEISDQTGRELFHFVVDSNGERQVLFFGGSQSYRLTLSCLEELVARAKDKVRYVAE